MRQTLEAGEDDGHRILDKDRTQRPSEDDHGGGGLHHLAEIATFQQQSEQDATESKHQTDEGRLIHAGSTCLLACGSHFQKRVKLGRDCPT